MKCPKCGYTRKMGETVPDWQCPSCGVAYAKADTASARTRASAGSGGGGKFLMLLVVVALAGGGWAMWKSGRPAPAPAERVVQAGQATVIMYSLTTCGFCNQKRAQLTEAGIPFVEYFIDTDQARFDELIGKLEVVGMRGGGIGTPSFDVNGKILLNNPSLETIRNHL